jgi:hypothetical protein
LLDSITGLSHLSWQLGPWWAANRANHAAPYVCGYALDNKGHNTRTIRGWLGYRSITSTAVYTALAPNRFKDCDEKPVVPPGFQVSLFAAGLERPRQMRVAPNGDVFVVESGSGRIRVLRPSENGEPRKEVFAAGLNQPFGVSFYPPDADPQWVYVGGTLADDRFAKNITISDAHFRLSGIFMIACWVRGLSRSRERTQGAIALLRRGKMVPAHKAIAPCGHGPLLPPPARERKRGEAVQGL